MKKPAPIIPTDVMKALTGEQAKEAIKAKSKPPVHEHTSHAPEHVKTKPKSAAHNSGGPTRMRSSGRGK